MKNNPPLTIKAGGVPEHFNYPWLQAINNGKFAEKGIDLKWQQYPGGTGAMCKDLREGTLDVAILLTEGIVADIVNGNPSKILQTYVQSPLIWGVHVNVASNYQSTADAVGKRFAISRYFSGSHLMAYVHANRNGWTAMEEDFVVVGNLDGARKALKANEAELFLWEKYTTKPLVDVGEFRRIDECPTPWPSFVIAVREEVLENNPEAISTMLEVINKSAGEFMLNPNAAEIIANNYHLELPDAQAWFKDVKWNTLPEVDTNMLVEVSSVLASLGVIPAKLTDEQAGKMSGLTTV